MRNPRPITVEPTHMDDNNRLHFHVNFNGDTKHVKSYWYSPKYWDLNERDKKFLGCTATMSPAVFSDAYISENEGDPTAKYLCSDKLKSRAFKNLCDLRDINFLPRTGSVRQLCTLSDFFKDSCSVKLYTGDSVEDVISATNDIFAKLNEMLVAWKEEWEENRRALDTAHQEAVAYRSEANDIIKGMTRKPEMPESPRPPREYPNGFTSWAETHYEVSVILHQIHEDTDIDSATVRTMAETLTDKFEARYIGADWGGELDWYEEMDSFMKTEVTQ